MNNQSENKGSGSPVAEGASTLSNDLIVTAPSGDHVAGTSSHGRISLGGSGDQAEDPKPHITELFETIEYDDSTDDDDFIDVPKTADPKTSKSEGVDPEAGKSTGNRACRRAHSEDGHYNPYSVKRACQVLSPEAFEQLLRCLVYTPEKEEDAQEETDANRGAEVDNKENAPPTEVEQREEDEVGEDQKKSD
ncbi:uncharacterized protein LOC108109709 [Drosophila eugracilis]|uniref:uncharacterized protein LOC108109709 n=1 Tax=Drosophila eugracilis TaxID=29029 RepID=UPI0007E6D92A|nr:uncharacterized protein LOC108109709 [Drosophila eugracilis]